MPNKDLVILFECCNIKSDITKEYDNMTKKATIQCIKRTSPRKIHLRLPTTTSLTATRTHLRLPMKSKTATTQLRLPTASLTATNTI